MATTQNDGDRPRDPGRVFATTQWSEVLAAGADSSPAASEALENLCRTYWYPLYVYVRRRGTSAEDSEDLTQAFFVHFLEKRTFRRADQERGRFRSFLLTSLKHFLIDEWAHAQAQKRGGGKEIFSLDQENSESRFLAEPADGMTPEKSFERRWAITLLEQAMAKLDKEFGAAGKTRLLEELRPMLVGEEQEKPYAEIASSLQMTEGTLRVTIHRLRQRYRELLRDEIANTVATPEEVDDEIRHLFAALNA